MMQHIGSAGYAMADALLRTMPFLNGILGLVIVVYIVHRLLCCASEYNRSERVGMGMTAAGMVLATPALWIANTPFDGWSFNVARVGIVIYIVTGGMRRDRHAKRNALAREVAERWLARKARQK